MSIFRCCAVQGSITSMAESIMIVWGIDWPTFLHSGDEGRSI
jgi:hypothetical protein